MYCINCGTKYEGKFCPNCGTKSVLETQAFIAEETTVEQKKQVDMKGSESSGINISFKLDEKSIRRILDITGIIASIFLSLGCVLPLFKINFLGLTESVRYVEGDGIFVMIGAAIMCMVCILRKTELMLIPLVIDFGIMLYSGYSIICGIQDEMGDMTFIKNMITVSSGFVCLIIGIVLGTASAGIKLVKFRTERFSKRNWGIAIGIGLGMIVLSIGTGMVRETLIRFFTYKAAVELMEEKSYTEAIEKFSELQEYKDSEEKVIECRYGIAMQEYENKNYIVAKSLFEELAGYQEADDMVLACIYDEAGENYADGYYTDAMELYGKLKAYKDSNDKIKDCIFQLGCRCEEYGQYEEAIEYYEKIPQYRNINDRINACKRGIAEECYMWGLYQEALTIYLELPYDTEIQKRISECESYLNPWSYSDTYYYDIPQMNIADDNAYTLWENRVVDPYGIYEITVPDSWLGRCVVRMYDNGFSLCERNSYESGYGGMLFSISLYSNGDYTEFPEQRVLGNLYTSGMYFDMVVGYPSDVQFGMEYMESYQEMNAGTEDVLNSIMFLGEALFMEGESVY